MSEQIFYHQLDEESRAIPLSIDDEGKLDSSSLLESEQGTSQFQGPRSKQHLLSPCSIALHLCFIVGYTVLFFTVVCPRNRQAEHYPKEMIYTPAREAVFWTRKLENNPLGLKTPYNGPPSTEVDEAWGRLLQNSNIKISADDLRKLNKSSIQLQDGSGMYFSGLGVHHHLHCLVNILIPSRSPLSK
jgi:hypothetical protein